MGNIINTKMIKRGDEVSVVGSPAKGIVIGYTQRNGYEQCVVLLDNTTQLFTHRTRYYDYQHLNRTGNHVDLDQYYTKSTVEIPKYLTEGYEYGGYHFIPYSKIGKFKSISDIVLISDTELGFFDNDYDERKQKFPYSYQEFYNAMNHSDMDVFKCIENGKLYVPCFHELFIYQGNRYEQQK